MANALWHTSPTTSMLRKAVQTTESAYCTVQSLYSLVSTGTERLVAMGNVPISLHSTMKVPYQEGNFTFPIKYGYSLVGRVTHGPAEWRNTLVHILHPHQDVCTVRPADLFPVPEAVPPLRATLASNLETALTALWDANVAVGDRVLVVGFGMIGALVARLLQMMPAVSLLIHETDTERAAVAQRMGFTLASLPKDDFDTAFHCSSSETGLQTSIESVGFEGKVIELSWYGTRSVSVHLGGSFHQQRKQLISSQVSSLPAHRRARWNFQRRKEVVFELLKSDRFDQHITETVSFEHLPSLFDRIRQGDRSALGWGVEY